MATIEPPDVIRLIEQYLKENNLLRTLQTLQDETSVSLNTVESIEAFVNDITSGHWDVVLKVVKILKLPDNKLIDLYEHIAIELIELRETRAANWLIHKTEPIQKLKSISIERYTHLQNLLAKSFFDPKEAYRDGGSKERRRALIANDLKREVSVVPPQRLLSLIRDSLKWQKHEGLLPEATSIDIFTGKAHIAQAEAETHPNILHKHCIKPIRNSEDNQDDISIFVCCADFSPDGHYIVVGYSTGLIEVRNPTTGRLANDLKYQVLKNFMVTPTKRAALTLCFSSSEMLAVGDKSGDISIWRLETGQLLQVFQSAHVKSVSCVLFHRNGKEILSGGRDGAIKLHGMRSNKTIRDFKGHKSFVYGLAQSRDGNCIVSGGSDSLIKIWNAKTAQLLNELKSSSRIHTILLMPSFKSDIFLVGDLSRSIQLIDLELKVRSKLVDEIQSAAGDKSNSGKSNSDQNDESKQISSKSAHFYAACASPKGNWIYAVDSQQLYCFNYSTKRVQRTLLANDDSVGNDLIGVKHHPFLNLIATFDTQASLNTWTSNLYYRMRENYYESQYPLNGNKDLHVRQKCPPAEVES